jgi:hypothetical protein
LDCGDEMICRQVGFARSLLAYELRDGRLKVSAGKHKFLLPSSMKVW